MAIPILITWSQRVITTTGVKDMSHYTIDYRSLERREALTKAALDTRRYLGPELTVRLRDTIRKAYDEKGVRYAYHIASLGFMFNGVQGYYPCSGFIRWALQSYAREKAYINKMTIEGHARLVN
jgi:hypothetical protein